jgi:hypothetical protein
MLRFRFTKNDADAARKDQNSKSRRKIITEASTTMSSVVARKDQNSKSSVFQTRCSRLTGKITKLTTAKAASKLVVPSSFRIIEKPPSRNVELSPAIALGMEYWKDMKELLNEEEFKELKKEHRHEKYAESLAKKGGAVVDSSSPLSIALAVVRE